MSTSTTQKPTTRRIVGMVVGIVIIGLGIALFKQSHLGNDSISALNMRLAELLGISLGVQNVAEMGLLEEGDAQTNNDNAHHHTHDAAGGRLLGGRNAHETAS